MAIPTIQEIGGVVSEPELRFTKSGTPILNFRLAFNDSKYDEQAQKWQTTKTFYTDAQVWDKAGERLAEVLRKGDQVFVSGRLETQSWEQDGQSRSKPVLNVRTVRKLEVSRPAQSGANTFTPNQQVDQGGWGQQAQSGFDQEPPF